MQSIEETMAVLHFENNAKGINALEEIEIMKITTSNHKLNIIQINQLYKILQPLQDQTGTSIDSCPYKDESRTKMCNKEF